MTKNTKNQISDVKYKTELCRTWIEQNYCPYLEKCRFAHGKTDLLDKTIIGKNYKLKDCKSFHTKGYCPYGPRCLFKHEERKFSNLNRPFYKYILENNFTDFYFKNLKMQKISEEDFLKYFDIDEILQHKESNKSFANKSDLKSNNENSDFCFNNNYTKNKEFEKWKIFPLNNNQLRSRVNLYVPSLNVFKKFRQTDSSLSYSTDASNESENSDKCLKANKIGKIDDSNIGGSNFKYEHNNFSRNERNIYTKNAHNAINSKLVPQDVHNKFSNINNNFCFDKSADKNFKLKSNIYNYNNHENKFTINCQNNIIKYSNNNINNKNNLLNSYSVNFLNNLDLKNNNINKSFISQNFIQNNQTKNTLQKSDLVSTINNYRHSKINSHKRNYFNKYNTVAETPNNFQNNTIISSSDEGIIINENLKLNNNKNIKSSINNNLKKSNLNYLSCSSASSLTRKINDSVSNNEVTNNISNDSPNKETDTTYNLYSFNIFKDNYNKIFSNSNMNFDIYEEFNSFGKLEKKPSLSNTSVLSTENSYFKEDSIPNSFLNEFEDLDNITSEKFSFKNIFDCDDEFEENNTHHSFSKENFDFKFRNNEETIFENIIDNTKSNIKNNIKEQNKNKYSENSYFENNLFNFNNIDEMNLNEKHSLNSTPIINSYTHFFDKKTTVI